MVKLKTLIVLLILPGIFAACKKDDNPPATRTDLLVAPKVWKLSGWTVNPGLTLQNGTVVTNLYDFIPSTSQDDVMKFYREPATYIEEEGASKGPGAAQIKDAGNWLLSIDETDIFLDSGSGPPLNYTIAELTNNSLVFSYVDVDPNGTSRTYVKSYTAQQ